MYFDFKAFRRLHRNKNDTCHLIFYIFSVGVGDGGVAVSIYQKPQVCYSFFCKKFTHGSSIFRSFDEIEIITVMWLQLCKSIER